MSKSQAKQSSTSENTSLTRSEIEAIRRQLLAKRQDLTDAQETQLNELADPSDKHHLADLEEMASDANGVESLCQIMDIEGTTVAQIDAALERIGEGTYGTCEVCEQTIPRARLEALPFANLCIECQRKKEDGQE